MVTGILLRDAVRQGCRTRAYMDVFTAVPQKNPGGHAVLTAILSWSNLDIGLEIVGVNVDVPADAVAGAELLKRRQGLLQNRAQCLVVLRDET